MRFEQLMRTTWFCRPNHVLIRVKPYPNGLCDLWDQRVRTPSLLAHITCQRAWVSGITRFPARAPQYRRFLAWGQGGKRWRSNRLKPRRPPKPPIAPGRLPELQSPIIYRTRADCQEVESSDV